MTSWVWLFMGFLLFMVFVVRVGLSPHAELTDFAQVYGDFVGTLVSAIALVMLVRTVLQQQDSIEKQQKGLDMQREELQLTRQELKETREELQRTADAQQQQVDIAQMAAQLNATASLLDSATQELAGLGPFAEPQEKRDERRTWASTKVEFLRNELQSQSDKLATKVESSSVRTMPAPQRNSSAIVGSTTDGEEP